MILSDCAACWDTPCSCGYTGYVVVRPELPQEWTYEQKQDFHIPHELHEQLRVEFSEILTAKLKERGLLP